jgi:hypothetical protein
MKDRKFLVSAKVLLSLMLIAVMAFSLVGCNNTKKADDTQKVTTVVTTEAQEEAKVEVKELGEGKTSFSFNVKNAEGKEQAFLIKTDAKTVGEALLAEKLIAGDESEYGLYVKTVCGDTYDYEKDGYYWAFYVNGEYAQSGVDATDIEADAVYSFEATPAE